MKDLIFAVGLVTFPLLMLHLLSMDLKKIDEYIKDWRSNHDM